MRKKYTIIEHKIDPASGMAQVSVELVSIIGDPVDTAARVAVLRGKVKNTQYRAGFEPYMYTVKLEDVPEETDTDKIMNALALWSDQYTTDQIRDRIEALVKTGELTFNG